MRSYVDEGEARAALAATRAFTASRPARAAWQVLSTLALVVAVLVAASWIGPSPWALLFAPLLAALFVRVFVLQHDAGHRSLFVHRRTNDAIGFLLSSITSVPFEAWRTEHNWHHNNQGNLDKRGVDRMNSPMKVEEIPERPEEAAYRIRKISFVNVFFFGAISLLVERRRPKGFFPFRAKFTDPVHNRAAMVRSIVLSPLANLGWQALVLVTLGWWVNAFVVLPAMVIGAGIGGLMFWVQHNFEATYHAERARWSYARVAIEGSSYLALNPALTWVTASIGLHHVHHLNPRIPNYRLEEARRAISTLSEVTPLRRDEIGRCFTHLFWDPAAARMRPPEQVGLPARRSDP